jgi:hypothetical protein
MTSITHSIHNTGQRLTLGGCKAPSRGEGRALTGPLCDPVQRFDRSGLEYSND